MKKLFVIIILAILGVSSGLAQNPQWIYEFPIDNQLNPMMVNSHLLPDKQGGHYLIGVNKNKMSYSSTFLGNVSIAHVDANGTNMGIVYEWYGKAVVHKASLFENGNLLLTGMYYDTLIVPYQVDFTQAQNHHFLIVMTPGGVILHAEDMEDDHILSSTTTNDGGYALLKKEYGTFMDYLIKYNLAFQPVDSIPIEDQGFLMDLVVDPSGDLQIVGSCSNSNMMINSTVLSSQSGYNAYVVQLDDTEEPEWLFQYEDITCSRIDVLSESKNQTIVAGRLHQPTMIGSDSIQGPTQPAYMSTDCFVASVDSSGSIEWVFDTPNQFGNGNFHAARNNAIAPYQDGYVILGQFYGDSAVWASGHAVVDTFNYAYTEGTPMLLYVSSEGEVMGTKLFKGGNGLYLHDIQTDANDNIYISGLTNQPAQFENLSLVADYNNQKLFVLKIGLESMSNTELVVDQKIHLYPNPASVFLSIEIEEVLSDKDIEVRVFDITGRTHLHDRFSDVRNNFELNISGLNSGMYLVSISGEKSSQTLRFMRE